MPDKADSGYSRGTIVQAKKKKPPVETIPFRRKRGGGVILVFNYSFKFYLTLYAWYNMNMKFNRIFKIFVCLNLKLST